MSIYCDVQFLNSVFTFTRTVRHEQRISCNSRGSFPRQMMGGELRVHKQTAKKSRDVIVLNILERLPRTVFNYRPQGGRNLERPRMRLFEQVASNLGTVLMGVNLVRKKNKMKCKIIMLSSPLLIIVLLGRRCRHLLHIRILTNSCPTAYLLSW